MVMKVKKMESFVVISTENGALMKAVIYWVHVEKHDTCGSFVSLHRYTNIYREG